MIRAQLDPKIQKKISSFTEFIEKNAKETWVFVLSIFTAYSPLLVSGWGFMDDYCVAGHGHDFVRHALGHGRPIFAIWHYLFDYIHSFDGFLFFRALSIVIVVLIFFAVRAVFLEVTKNKLLSSWVALLFSMLPCIQVFSWWAICTPFLLAALLAFFAIYLVIQKSDIKTLFAASALVICSILIYQPSALIYVSAIPIVAYKSNLSLLRLARLVLIPYFLALTTSFVILKLFPTTDGRTAIGMQDIHPKLNWYFGEMLPRSAAFFWPSFAIAPTIIGTVLIAFGSYAISKRGGIKSLGAILLGIPLASACNIGTQENWASTRSITALSIYFFIVAAFGVFYLFEIASAYSCKKWLLNTLYVILFGVAALNLTTTNRWLAMYVVSPQLGEVRCAKLLLSRPEIDLQKTVYAIPASWSSWSPKTYYDEYGTPSSSASWNTSSFLRFVAARARRDLTTIEVIKSDEVKNYPSSQVVDLRGGE